MLLYIYDLPSVFSYHRTKYGLITVIIIKTVAFYMNKCMEESESICLKKANFICEFQSRADN